MMIKLDKITITVLPNYIDQNTSVETRITKQDGDIVQRRIMRSTFGGMLTPEEEVRDLCYSIDHIAEDLKKSIKDKNKKQPSDLEYCVKELARLNDKGEND